MTEFFALAHGQRAHRYLRADPVPDDLIERILDVATKAPSAENSQPWEFVVVEDAAIRSALSDQARLLWERGGRDATKPEVDTYGWRDVDAWATGAFAQAPVMIVVCGDSRKMDASRLPSSIFPAVQNILLAAIDLGLGSLLSTLPVVSADDARAILALPDHLVPLALIPIGWPARTLRPPTRHSFAEKTHRDRYGTPWK